MVIVMKLEVAFRIPAAGIALRGDSVRTRTGGRGECGLSQVKCDVRLHSGDQKCRCSVSSSCVTRPPLRGELRERMDRTTRSVASNSCLADLGSVNRPILTSRQRKRAHLKAVCILSPLPFLRCVLGAGRVMYLWRCEHALKLVYLAQERAFGDSICNMDKTKVCPSHLVVATPETGGVLPRGSQHTARFRTTTPKQRYALDQRQPRRRRTLPRKISTNDEHLCGLASIMGRSKSLFHVVKQPPRPGPHPQDCVYVVSMVTAVADRRFSRVARQVYAQAMTLLYVPGSCGCVSQV